MTKRRIVIIGSGHVGSHCAYSLACNRIADEIVLLDLDGDKANAHAMDIADSLSFLDAPSVVRSGEYSDCREADIVVVAVGESWSKGMTRLDMLDNSVMTARDVAANLKKTDYDGIVISITNPADIIADCIRKQLEKERWRVFSTGTLLDTGRLLRTLSEMTGCDRRSIQAFSMGEHGDSSMIPFSNITIGGISLDKFPEVSRDVLLERTRMIGMDILAGKGSTEFGIGTALCYMAKSILNDEKRIMPASVLLEGEYGQHGVHCGVPCVIGSRGIEKILEIELSPAEQEQLDHSCDIIRKYIERADSLPPR